ncbi:hypothetical protein [Paraburkholderia atlantica]|uniref:hypothetical protein n=1 Tax=Paraburkholderia atlantica TaxID=2654982 RepID=UPI000370DE3D|nr:hypothetical protein [Paraburkholderia atlantica]
MTTNTDAVPSTPDALVRAYVSALLTNDVEKAADATRRMTDYALTQPALAAGGAADDESARIQDYAEQNMLTLEEAVDELRAGAVPANRVQPIAAGGAVQLAEVCEDADGTKHIESVVEDLDDVPAGTKLYAGQLPRGAATVPRPETTAEHIARDIREGRFPKRSEPQMMSAAAPQAAATVPLTADQRRGLTYVADDLKKSGFAELDSALRALLAASGDQQ